MHQTEFKYEKKQRAITQKLSKQELKFMCTDEIYPPSKFCRLYSLGDMLQTKFRYENIQRATTKKIIKQELRFMCTAHPLDEIYPPTKFHNHI